jgi:uncharacterized protein
MTSSDDAGSPGGRGRHPLADAKYVQLTTYRKTGVPVSSPVWVAADDANPQRLVVITVDNTGKTKRLGHTSRVELRPCGIRGQVADDAPTYGGTAEVVRDAVGVSAVRRAVVAKYGLPARFSDLTDSVLSKVGLKRSPRAGIRIVPDADPRPVA